MDATFDADNYNRSSQTQEVGSKLQSAGTSTLTAGQDITARAADVQAQTGLNVTAGNNVVIEAGVATRSVASASKTSNSGFMSSSTRTERSSTSSTQAIASEFGGNTVTISSGKDLSVKASNVVADKDLTLTAAGNVRLEAGTNTQTQTSFSALSESGLMSSGGLDASIGNRDQSTDQKTTRTSAAASTVGSTGGNVTITAGKTYTQTGSDVLASGTNANGARLPGAGNITITAQKVDIVEARETSNSETKTKFEQSGITLSLSNPVVSAAQTMQKMATAADNTKSERMKALAAASAALAAKNAAPAVSKLMNGQVSSDDIAVSLSVGSSSSESKTTSSSNTARGSSVSAAGNTTIRATGDGQNSNLTIQGSTVQSGDTTTLAADNKVQLLAAANTATQTSDQKSSSGSVGVTLGKGKFGVTVSAAQGSGDGNGQDLSYTNTQIGGKTVNLQSGGDTTLQGAVVKANTANATVGGNLNIQSLQSSSRYKESSQNASGSITIGAGAGGSVSAGATNINSNYLSVTEQSGIRAGDGGYNVNVQGNTDLQGGAITSTQKAIDDNKNSFTTAKLTTSDLQNSASYSAESYQVSVGTSGGSAGAGQDSGSASSTTKAAISGIAGNKNARTGDAETGIKKIFDQAAVTKDINAQVQITNEFGKQAPKAVADYAQAKAEALTKAGNTEEAQKWKEGGIYRIALHTTLGALSGGASGAAGAATIASTAPLMDKMQEQLTANLEKAGLSKEVAEGISKTIAQTTALAVGSAVGGVQGGSLALNVDANNRQLTHTEAQRIKQLAKGDVKKEARLTDAACAMVKCSAEFATGSQDYISVKNSEIRGAGYTYELKQLADEQKSDSSLFSYGAWDKTVDTSKNIGNTAARAGSKVVDLGKGMAKGAANAVKEGALTLVDGAQTGVAIFGPGQSVDNIEPISEMGKSIKKNGLVDGTNKVVIDTLAGTSDAMKAAGQGDMEPIGEVIGGVAGPIAVGKVIGKTIGAVKDANGGATSSNTNVPLTKEYFEGRYGEGNVVQGGGVSGATRERVDANIQQTKAGNESSNYLGGSANQGAIRGDILNDQATRSVGKVTAPIDFDGHILSAEIKSNGTVVGGHSTANGTVQVVPGTASVPNAQGVYSARIEVADPSNPGQFVPKTNNGGVSTLFPDSWTADRIKVEVDAAFQNRTVSGNKWTGITPSGVKVEGFLNPKVTVYPKL